MDAETVASLHCLVHSGIAWFFIIMCIAIGHFSIKAKENGQKWFMTIFLSLDATLLFMYLTYSASRDVLTWILT